MVESQLPFYYLILCKLWHGVDTGARPAPVISLLGPLALKTECSWHLKALFTAEDKCVLPPGKKKAKKLSGMGDGERKTAWIVFLPSFPCGAVIINLSLHTAIVFCSSLPPSLSLCFSFSLTHSLTLSLPEEYLGCS